MSLHLHEFYVSSGHSQDKTHPHQCLNAPENKELRADRTKLGIGIEGFLSAWQFHYPRAQGGTPDIK